MSRKKIEVEPLAGRAKVHDGFAAGLTICPLCKAKVLVEVRNKNDDPEVLGRVMGHDRGGRECECSGKLISELRGGK